MKNLPLLIGTIVVTLGLIVGAAVLFPSDNGATPTEQVTDEVLIAENSHVKGPADAPVTIVEFSDFQCPACKSAEPLVNDILNQYSDKVRFIYRHFPLDNLHPYARVAAQAAEAAVSDVNGKADEQFFAYHDLLFERQAEWSNLKSLDAVRDTLAEYATELELDKDQFLSRMKDSTVVAQVVKDAATAKQLNLGGTPTFFVNGRRVPAQQLLDAVQSIVEANNTKQ